MHKLSVTQKMVYMLSAVARRMLKSRAHFIQMISILCSLWTDSEESVCVKFKPSIWPEHHNVYLSLMYFTSVTSSLSILSHIMSHVQMFYVKYSINNRCSRTVTTQKVKLREKWSLKFCYWMADTEMQSAYWEVEMVVLKNTPWKSIKAGFQALSVLCCQRTYNMWMHEACVRNV